MTHTSGCKGDDNCTCGQQVVGKQRGAKLAVKLVTWISKKAGKAAKSVGLD